MRSLVVIALLVLSATSVSLFAQEVFTPKDEGITAPKVVRLVRAAYTEKAAAARIEGTVTMEAVVLQDGTVGEVTVTGSLDSSLNGLDDQATGALRKSEFEPGTRNGKAVAVRVVVRTQFSLK